MNDMISAVIQLHFLLVEQTAVTSNEALVGL